MLATPERVKGCYGSTPDTIVWHKPVGPVVEDFQPIACSDDEGIVLPGPKQDVPRNLDKPGERWCTDCLTAARTARGGLTRDAS